jgi:hypothetical protein
LVIKDSKEKCTPQTNREIEIKDLYGETNILSISDEKIKTEHLEMTNSHRDSCRNSSVNDKLGSDLERNFKHSNGDSLKIKERP